MKYFVALFLFSSTFGFAQTKKVYTTTLTYPEIVKTYEDFAKKSSLVKLFTYGTTDVGKPLQLLVISKNKNFDADSLRKQNKRILLINNGIHPGEPDGIDACVELVNTLLKDEKKIPDDVVICIIPVYNIDGCLNRGKYSRANQNGPEEYGFRGNAQNLDLNRDFIKADAENTKTFIQIFQGWKPDVFVDTHTSDGADYQYVMTLISTQRNKLAPILSKYMTAEMLPQLYSKMKDKKYEMCPYVETKDDTPDNGIVEFLETPRFSTGYAAQFNTIGFVTETHMWKPYNDRVWATYEFLLALIEVVQYDAGKIGVLKSKADKFLKYQETFPLNWKLDTTQFDSIEFKGYKAVYKTSSVTGLQRLYYDRNKPYTKKIRFYNSYTPTVKIEKPSIYIIPQAWKEVIARLKLNGIEMKQLSKDTSITCEAYYIISYQTSKNPYEGHYLHYGTQVKKETQTLSFFKGDYVIYTNQTGNRYIVETLEPECDDSFFAWNFFDAVLNQKEWFSDYIFEEKAEEVLQQDTKLKLALEEKKKSDKDFASNHWAQLAFIYKNSPYYEKSHNRYPVARLNAMTNLPVN